MARCVFIIRAFFRTAFINRALDKVSLQRLWSHAMQEAYGT